MDEKSDLHRKPPHNWRDLHILEKLTYFAQIASIAIVFPTVLFSYLTFREANLTRIEQQQMFLAEKIPRITLEKIRVEKNTVVATFKDAGSMAINVRIKTYFVPTTGKFSEVGYREGRAFQISNGERKDIDIADIRSLEELAGQHPLVLRPESEWTAHNGFDDGVSSYLKINMEYENSLEHLDYSPNDPGGFYVGLLKEQPSSLNGEASAPVR